MTIYIHRYLLKDKLIVSESSLNAEELTEYHKKKGNEIKIILTSKEGRDESKTSLRIVK